MVAQFWRLLFLAGIGFSSSIMDVRFQYSYNVDSDTPSFRQLSCIPTSSPKIPYPENQVISIASSRYLQFFIVTRKFGNYVLLMLRGGNWIREIFRKRSLFSWKGFLHKTRGFGESYTLYTRYQRKTWVGPIKHHAPRRGIEPRSPAWQAGILATILTRNTFSLAEIMID